MNRTVLVTGASRGIGRAIASAFAAEGDRLIITCSRSEQELLNFKKELEETFHTEVLASVGDISSFEYVEQLFEQITERFGGVDVLINNAGISYIGLLTDMSIDDWNRIVSTNLTSVFSTSRLAIPHMVHEKKGKIINISSVWGIAGASCEVAYSATKGAINSLTMALAKELAPSHIAVNAIAFGAVDTTMNGHLSVEEKKTLCEEIPAEKMAAPEEAAACISHILAMPDYMTGEILKFDGGWI